MINKNHIIRKGFRIIIISLLPLSVVQANDLPSVSSGNISIIKQPSISIIIDDMGYRLKSGHQAINLPGAITYSFLPHSPHVILLAKRAHEQEKEVMLHLPMEAENGKKLGPGGLTECMTEKKFEEVLASSINSIPFAKGFNNHMGSLLTKSPLWMTKLMHAVAINKPLFFVDSKTTSDSVALKFAHAEGLKGINRDIFIDHEESKEFIEKQLRKLITRARLKGTALAIAHPKKITLFVLAQWLPELEAKGIKLVPVSTLINLQEEKKFALLKVINHPPQKVKN